MYNEYQDEYFNRLADEFEEMHPEIDVVIERVTGGSWTDYKISLLNDYGNRTPPDVARINEGWLGQIIGAGLLDPAPDDIAEYLDTQPISPGLRNLMKVGGETYGVIHAATWQCLYYNKDHFIEAGLDPDHPPENWDELIDYAQRLTVYDDDGDIVRAGLSLRKSGFAPGTAMKFFDFYFSAGGEIFNEDRTHCLINSEAGVRSLQFYLDCLYTWRVDDFEVLGDNDGFANGTVSMFYRGPWVMNFLADNAPDINYGVANICADEISASNGGMYPFVVASDSKEKELAWEFIRYIMEPDNQAEYAANENMVPFDAVASQYPEFRDNEGFQVFLDQQNVKEFPAVPNQDEIQTKMGEMIERVARSGLEGEPEDPQEALDALVEEIDALLVGEVKESSIDPRIVSGIVIGVLLIAALAWLLIWWLKDPDSRWGYIMIAPMLIYFAIFFVYPIVTSFTLSFWDYNLLQPSNPFVGLDNYKQCLGDDNFLMALRNTGLYAFWVVLLGTIISLALAVVLNRALEAVGLFRTLYFIPVITSIMAAVLVWKYLYRPNEVGLFNMILGWFGVDPINWLQGDGNVALGALIVMAIWKNMGFNMIIFLAGLKAIPDMYYEAASIDGASGWQKFRHITLPALKPTIIFVVVTSLISTFQVFTQIIGMTEGGPGNATRTIVYHIYEVGFSFFDLGYASAAAVVMLVIVGFITWIQMRLARD